MYYEINVAKLNTTTGRYEHYFATSERSIINLRTLVDMMNDFRIRFPESEGFNITCTKWEKIGKEIEINYCERTIE